MHFSPFRWLPIESLSSKGGSYLALQLGTKIFQGLFRFQKLIAVDQIARSVEKKEVNTMSRKKLRDKTLRDTGSWSGPSLNRDLESPYAKCSPWTSNVSLTRELSRNAESQAPSQTYRTGICILTKFPGDPCADKVWDALEHLLCPTATLWTNPVLKERKGPKASFFMS